ncbi:hypothetical protein U3516DRAFT_781542 [Neocallimastix sp. 'constans']
MKDFHILTKFKATTFATTGLIGQIYFLFGTTSELTVLPLSDTSTTEKIDMTYITKPKFTRRHGFSKQHTKELFFQTRLHNEIEKRKILKLERIIKENPKREALDCSIYAKAVVIALGIDRLTDKKREQNSKSSHLSKNKKNFKKMQR